MGLIDKLEGRQDDDKLPDHEGGAGSPEGDEAGAGVFPLPVPDDTDLPPEDEDTK